MSAQIYVVAEALGRPVGRWVKVYEPDGYDGRGRIEFTDDREDALAFPDRAAAMAAWMRPSMTHPVHYDGRPNRPLTAYTVEVVDASQEPVR